MQQGFFGGGVQAICKMGIRKGAVRKLPLSTQWPVPPGTGYKKY